MSRAAAEQRAGRAGRTAPGIAVRLWRAEQTAALEAFDRPEILATDLSGLLLDCAAWGVADPSALAFLDPPPAPAVAEARALLQALGALDGEGRLTPVGEAMRALPLPPRLARMVVGAEPADREAAARIAVLLTERGLGGNDVDLSERLRRFGTDRSPRAKAAAALARRIARAAGAEDGRSGTAEPGELLALSYPDRVAIARGARGHFVLANGRGGAVDETSALASGVRPRRRRASGRGASRPHPVGGFPVPRSAGGDDRGAGRGDGGDGLRRGGPRCAGPPGDPARPRHGVGGADPDAGRCRDGACAGRRHPLARSEGAAPRQGRRAPARAAALSGVGGTGCVAGPFGCRAACRPRGLADALRARRGGSRRHRAGGAARGAARAGAVAVRRTARRAGAVAFRGADGLAPADPLRGRSAGAGRPGAGTLRADPPPGDRRRPAAADARTPVAGAPADPGDARPSQLLGRLLGGCQGGSEGPLSRSMSGRKTRRAPRRRPARSPAREKGLKVSNAEMESLDITGDAFHPEWNYTIKPRASQA